MLDRFFAALFGSSQDRFVIEALEAARRSPGVTGATRVAGEFAIAVTYANGVGTPSRLYLANLFRELDGASRAERRERLDKLVRVMAAPAGEGGWDAVREKLRPVLRPVTFGMGGPAGMPPPLSRPALPFLRELVVVDHPEAMAYVVPPRLDEWGVTPDEVFAAARENLAELARESLDRPWPTEPGIITMLDDGDGYFTSLLMVPGWLADVSSRIGYEVVAFAPDNNTLLLCPQELAGAGDLFEVIEGVFRDAARSVSPVGYVADTFGRTVPYSPPSGHRDHVATTRAAAVLAATEYGNQTQWLSGEYAAAGIEVQVGALLAVAPPGGARTVAVWPDGVSSLLPGADSIAFADADGVERFEVPWEVVAEHTGLRPEPLLAPARYKVDGWPPPIVVDELKRHRTR